MNRYVSSTFLRCQVHGFAQNLNKQCFGRFIGAQMLDLTMFHEICSLTHLYQTSGTFKGPEVFIEQVNNADGLY